MHVGSVGRRSWLNRNSMSVSEAPAEEDEEEEDESAVAGPAQHADQEGHEIDETVQENSFKLTPCISRYDEDEEEDQHRESQEEDRRLGLDCDRVGDGLEGEIMSYFEKKLNERSDMGDQRESGELKLRHLSLDNDDIISQLIRSQPPPAALTSPVHLDNLTPVAASESDEQYPSEYLESDVDSDHRRMSPVESDDSTGVGRPYPGKGIQLATQFSDELDLDLPKKPAPRYPHHHATDSDSDVSDESGFIEYQDHHKYPNSVLV